MEEKERYYSLIDHNGNFTLRDYETGNELTNLFDLDDLLNQQDKRIKELEQEKQQLKQQLHDLPNKIVREIRKEIENLNNRILISQLQAPEEQRLKIVGSSCCQYNPKQDKISFALEQIQELKKFTEKEIKECNKLLQEELEDDYYIQSINARQSMCYEFKREIDNQIKELKGEK